MRVHRYLVPRTVRYYEAGEPVNGGPLWIVLHGYGQLARFFLRKFEAFEGQAHVVAPEGPNRFYLGDGYERIGANWMTREERGAEIAEHVEQLARRGHRLALGFVGPHTGGAFSTVGRFRAG